MSTEVDAGAGCTGTSTRVTAVAPTPNWQPEIIPAPPELAGSVTIDNRGPLDPSSPQNFTISYRAVRYGIDDLLCHVTECAVMDCGQRQQTLLLLASRDRRAKGRRLSAGMLEGNTIDSVMTTPFRSPRSELKICSNRTRLRVTGYPAWCHR